MSPPTKIIENLYLGDYQNATNLMHPIIQGLNIKHVINCCKGGQNFFPNYFHYYNLEWIDNENQEINKILEVINYIENALNKKEPVFVHCGAGISRSATVVIAYLMYKFNLPYQESYLFVKEKRPNIQPNKNFETQLSSLNLF